MTEPETRYVVVNRDGIDTLHRNAGEACNLDDTIADQKVDEATALRMKLGGFVRLCQHCYASEGEEPTA